MSILGSHGTVSRHRTRCPGGHAEVLLGVIVVFAVLTNKNPSRPAPPAPQLSDNKCCDVQADLLLDAVADDDRTHPVVKIACAWIRRLARHFTGVEHGAENDHLLLVCDSVRQSLGRTPCMLNYGRRQQTFRPIL